jgi:hypothetical protein
LKNNKAPYPRQHNKPILLLATNMLPENHLSRVSRWTKFGQPELVENIEMNCNKQITNG